MTQIFDLAAARAGWDSRMAPGNLPGGVAPFDAPPDALSVWGRECWASGWMAAHRGEARP